MVLIKKVAQIAAQKDKGEQFPDRVQLLLDRRGCTKMWLASQLGVSRQALNHILKHNKKPKYVSEIALIFEVTPRWLETGQGRMTPTTTPTQRALIDVYTLEQLATAQSESLTPVEQITSHNTDDDHSFAIKLGKYPAMSDKFKENSVLIFNRKKTPEDGDFVLVRLEKEILFRQMAITKKTTSLKATHEKYKSIPISGTPHEIIGTLIEIRTRF